jgi:hypothetical protein
MFIKNSMFQIKLALKKRQILNQLNHDVINIQPSGNYLVIVPVMFVQLHVVLQITALGSAKIRSLTLRNLLLHLLL